MITAFPLTFWTDKPLSGRTGTSWFFVCTAVRGHAYAAAIMAQEIYETRFKTLRAVAIATNLAALTVLAGVALGHTPTLIDVAAVAVLSLALGMLFTGLYAPWQRELELRGQAIECVVRGQRYSHVITDALDEAATQLLGYDQFKGWDHSRIKAELAKRGPFAFAWAAANRSMIDRALKATRK